MGKFLTAAFAALVFAVLSGVPAYAFNFTTTDYGTIRPALSAAEMRRIADRASGKLVWLWMQPHARRGETLSKLCSLAHYGDVDAARPCIRRSVRLFCQQGLDPNWIFPDQWYRIQLTPVELVRLATTVVTVEAGDQPAWVAKYATELTTVKEQNAANTVQIDKNTRAIDELNEYAEEVRREFEQAISANAAATERVARDLEDERELRAAADNELSSRVDALEEQNTGRVSAARPLQQTPPSSGNDPVTRPQPLADDEYKLFGFVVSDPVMLWIVCIIAVLFVLAVVVSWPRRSNQERAKSQERTNEHSRFRVLWVWIPRLWRKRKEKKASEKPEQSKDERSTPPEGLDTTLPERKPEASATVAKSEQNGERVEDAPRQRSLYSFTVYAEDGNQHTIPFRYGGKSPKRETQLIEPWEEHMVLLKNAAGYAEKKFRERGLPPKRM